MNFYDFLLQFIICLVLLIMAERYGNYEKKWKEVVGGSVLDGSRTLHEFWNMSYISAVGRTVL